MLVVNNSNRNVEDFPKELYSTDNLKLYCYPKKGSNRSDYICLPNATKVLDTFRDLSRGGARDEPGEKRRCVVMVRTCTLDRIRCTSCCCSHSSASTPWPCVWTCVRTACAPSAPARPDMSTRSACKHVHNNITHRQTVRWVKYSPTCFDVDKLNAFCVIL